MSYQKEMRRSLIMLTLAGVVTFGAVALNAFSPKNMRDMQINKQASQAQSLATQNRQVANASAQINSATSQFNRPVQVNNSKQVQEQVNFARSNSQSKPVESTRLHIEALQTSLKAQGFYDGDVDGLLGPNTQSAITLYRIAYQVPDGLQTPVEILQHMRNANKAKISQNNKVTSQTINTASNSTLPPLNIPNLTTGSIAPQQDKGITDENIVSNIQSILAEFGLNPGANNGKLSAQTVNAIKEFQDYKNIPVTGKIDNNLINILERISRRKVRG